MRERPCGNPECAVSSGIHEGLTFGSGTLDFNGFWSVPCAVVLVTLSIVIQNMRHAGHSRMTMLLPSRPVQRRSSYDE